MNRRGDLWDCTVLAGVLGQVREPEPGCQALSCLGGEVLERARLFPASACCCGRRAETLLCHRECQKTINTPWRDIWL